MLEDIVSTAARIFGDAYGPLGAIAAVLVMATVLVLLRRLGKLKFPTPPPVSPDLVENPPSPPITVQPDGSIPVSNEQGPPDPTRG